MNAPSTIIHQKDTMNASFEEKSVWIQLTSILLSLGFYFIIAGRLLYAGVEMLPIYVPLFIVAVVVIVLVNVAGHVVVAVTDRSTNRDERDRLIEWRAESNSSWILACGVIFAISCLIMSIEAVWVAHLLLLSLFVAEVVKYVLQLVYYRRGL